MHQITEYLSQQDPVLGNYLSSATSVTVAVNTEISLFQALVKSIISQQLSVTAASSIFRNVLTNFSNSGVLRPEIILATPSLLLRNCGLSAAKTDTVLSTAEKIVENTIPTSDEMSSMTDENIIATLTTIKGIGRWTAEMILIFHLGKPDVMPATDLGIQKGFSKIFGLEIRATPTTILERSERWRPYRTTVSLHCWKILDENGQ